MILKGFIADEALKRWMAGSLKTRLSQPIHYHRVVYPVAVIAADTEGGLRE
jgi:hypothetical protein